MKISNKRVLCQAILLLISPSIFAHEVESEKGSEILFKSTVLGQKPFTAASSSEIRKKDLKMRPVLKPTELVEVTPGMFAVQHSGGGKASQYFLRGFDADHGTDLAFFFDGIPINNVSHGHGQGYTDLNFIIPELVDTLDVYKGPYFSEFGNFSNAGTLQIRTSDIQKNDPHLDIKMTGASFNTARALVIQSETLGKGWSERLAFESQYSDGPFINPERLKRFNFQGKVRKEFDSSSFLDMNFIFYDANWHASGQIPSRLVNSGALDRFGFIDPSEGGITARKSVSLAFKKEFSPHLDLTASIYRVHYDFNLFSNFTFFLNDRTNGDQIEQTDNRKTTGGSLIFRAKKKLFGSKSQTLAGTQVRDDRIDNGLFSTIRRTRYSRPGFSPNQSFIGESNIAFFAEEDSQWSDWFRSVLGARYDYFHFYTNNILNRQSGNAVSSQFSPKVNFVFLPHRNWDIFLNYGHSFHSNDARSIFSSTAPTPLARSIGYEVGFRNRSVKDLNLAISGFALDLQDELVWVGDEGTTSSSGKSRRAGIEIELRYDFFRYFYADADLTFNQAYLTELPGGQNAIPLAPRAMASFGLSTQDWNGFFGSLRSTWIDHRPANEDSSLTAEGIFKTDFFIGKKFKCLAQDFEVSFWIQNILDAHLKGAQFATESQLQNEASSVEEIHFAPMYPRTFLLQVRANI